MRDHISPVRMTFTKNNSEQPATPHPLKKKNKPQKITRVGKDVKKLDILYTIRGGCEMVQMLWKTVWWFLKKLKIELPYDSAVPLLVYIQGN